MTQVVMVSRAFQECLPQVVQPESRVEEAMEDRIVHARLAGEIVVPDVAVLASPLPSLLETLVDDLSGDMLCVPSSRPR